MAAAAAPAARAAPADTRRDTLVIGLDIADTSSLDPARQANYSTPLALHACYDTLVTFKPGQYDDVVPCLARSWERSPDGQGWRFTLDPAATFGSGAPVTAEDCRFSLDRARAVADGAGQFITNLAAVIVRSADTFDLLLHRPDEALLGTLAATEYAILEKSSIQAAESGAKMAATEWLNQHSTGSGPYTLSGWARRQSIQLTASPHPWRGAPGYRRVVIAHMPYPEAQARALRRGDIDVACNLIPEQVAALLTDRQIRIETIRSLDFVYLALTADPARNKALADPLARQAIAAAIDYDDLLGRMLGGKALRPAHFLPIGVPGSTEAIAEPLRPKQDLDRARALLKLAALPDGFEFELSYGDDAIAGLSYASVARKLQTDLRRVGIKVKLNGLSPATLRARYLEGALQATLAFWNPPVVESRVWAEGLLERVAKRLAWTASPAIITLAQRAATADPAQRDTFWSDFQRAMLEAAIAIVLFQPIYEIAISNGVADLPLTGAGWLAEIGTAKPTT